LAEAHPGGERRGDNGRDVDPARDSVGARFLHRTSPLAGILLQLLELCVDSFQILFDVARGLSDGVDDLAYHRSTRAKLV
jgi:hypothetical protein